jgi:plasmid stability protein
MASNATVDISDIADIYAIIDSIMPALLIRGLDDDLKRQLRLRAAENGHSMEEEVRQILRRVLGVAAPAEVVETPPPEGRPATEEVVAPRSRPVQSPGRVRLFGRS